MESELFDGSRNLYKEDVYDLIHCSEQRMLSEDDNSGLKAK